MLKEFQEFALKGNVVDMAVGIVIGAAFSTIVQSFVNDILMPPIGLATGGIDFSNLSIVLAQATETTEAVEISYGKFINAVISFLIVAWALFIVIKGMNRLRKKADQKPAEAPPPPKEQVLLEEIRDILKTKG